MFHNKYHSRVLYSLFFSLLWESIIVARVGEQTLFADEVQTANNNEADGKPAKKTTSIDRPFEKLLTLIRQGERDSNALWNSVKDAPFVLSSGSPNASFHFESSYSNPDFISITGVGFTEAYTRQLMECRGTKNTVLRFHGEYYFPMLYFCNTHQIKITGANQYKKYQTERWGYVFDQSHLREPFDSEFGPKKYTSFLHFDFSSLLNGMMTGMVPSTEWEPVSRSLVLKKTNGTRLQLRFRSPSDAVRYGTHLAELRAMPSSGEVVSFQSFQTMPSSRTRLPHYEIKQVENSLNSLVLGERKPGLLLMWMPEQLWYATTSADYFPERKMRSGDFLKIDDYENLSLRERIIVLSTNFSEPRTSLTSVESKELPVEKVGPKLRDALLEQIQSMPVWLSKYRLNQSVYPDDPAMLWRELEAAFDPGGPTIMIKRVLKYILNNDNVTSETKISFLDAVGDWGFPPFLDNESIWKFKESIGDDVFFESILWSRWQWPCERKHINAAVKASRESEPGSHKERIAIETLIRLNEVPLILRHLMERWYRFEIVKASSARRRINLSVLSLQPSGRSYLLDRLKSKDDSIGIQTDIAKILQARVQATLKTKRFDFIAEDKCAEMLAITEPILDPL